MNILSDDAVRELIAERKPIPEGVHPLSRLTARNQHLRAASTRSGAMRLEITL
jgi:hypothetical protein